MTALADDPLSALFYNPAGLSDTPGENAQIGTGIYEFPVVYRSPDGISTENTFLSKAPYFGYSNDRFDPIFWGIGMYGSTGTGFEYDRDVEHGLYHKSTAELGNVYLSPTFAYKIDDRLSVGAGLNITYGLLKMGMPLSINSTDKLDIDIDGFSLGVNVGVLYKPTQYMSLGVRWRSRIKSELNGDAEVFGLKDDVTAYLYWPDVLTFGVGINLTTKLIFLCDYEWIDYSRFSNKSRFSYDTLTYLNGPFITDMRDAFRIHAGFEYTLNEIIVLRAGYLYNRWCIPIDQMAPLAPGNTYHTPHLGIEWKLNESIDLDVSGFRNFHKQREVSYSETGYPGIYNTPSHGIEIEVTYHFRKD